MQTAINAWHTSGRQNASVMWPILLLDKPTYWSISRPTYGKRTPRCAPFIDVETKQLPSFPLGLVIATTSIPLSRCTMCVYTVRLTQIATMRLLTA